MLFLKIFSASPVPGILVLLWHPSGSSLTEVAHPLELLPNAGGVDYAPLVPMETDFEGGGLRRTVFGRQRVSTLQRARIREVFEGRSYLRRWECWARKTCIQN